jgi:hypothetical protein
MRFTVGSIAATLVLTAALVCMLPGGSVAWAGAADEAPAATAMPEQEANKQAQEKLRTLIDINCPGPAGAPLAVALGQVAQSAGVQIYLDVPILAEMEMEGELPVAIVLNQVPAEMVLRLVLSQRGFAFKLYHGVVIATSPELLATDLDIRVYQISDLAEPDEAAAADAPSAAAAHTAGLEPSQLDELIDLITSTVEPRSWDGMGGQATIGEYRGTLVISQTSEGHEKIEQLLDGLRTVLAEE